MRQGKSALPGVFLVLLLVAPQAGGQSVAELNLSEDRLPSELAAGAAGALVATAVIAVILWIWAARRRRDQERERAWHAAVNALDSVIAPSTDRTLDALMPAESALAVLIVEKSDDLQLVGRHIEIYQPLTSLGRSANNDVIFAKDSPVSRAHAEIRERDGQLWFSPLITADKTGVPKLPTFGTFVNGQPVNSSVPLQDGDVIRLGKRVELRVELSRQSAKAGRPQPSDKQEGEKTMLAFDGGLAQDQVKPGDDKTKLVLNERPAENRNKPADEKTMFAFSGGPPEVPGSDEKTMLSPDSEPAPNGVKPADDSTISA